MTTPDRPEPPQLPDSFSPPAPRHTPESPPPPPTRDLDVPPIAVGAAGRWVRAVEGELVNLDGCDYVAVEQERGESYVVVARMHEGAANWVLARYGSRGEAIRAQEWLAEHLGAWRLDLAVAADGPEGVGDVGRRAG